jgi:hypothetical protein
MYYNKRKQCLGTYFEKELCYKIITQTQQTCKLTANCIKVENNKLQTHKFKK